MKSIARSALFRTVAIGALLAGHVACGSDASKAPSEDQALFPNVVGDTGARFVVVGGSVSGLTGTGLVLQYHLKDELNRVLSIHPTRHTFEFYNDHHFINVATQQNSNAPITKFGARFYSSRVHNSTGFPYRVSIQQQPINPPQICSITNGEGRIGLDHATNIEVSCADVPSN